MPIDMFEHYPEFRSIVIEQGLLSIRDKKTFLVLLRIPSSRPNPRTFSQFRWVQILGFLAAENDGFETYVWNFFHLISQIYTTKTQSKWHWRHFTYP